MDEKNRELLSKVTESRLKKALVSTGDDEADKVAFKEAMDAVSKELELEKLQSEAETKKAEARKDRTVRFVVLGAEIIAVPLIDFICKKRYARMLCEFEKDYTFTTTAGRGLSSLFRFKK